MIFADRKDAGRRLAAALLHHRGKDVIVYALPRGGVPVAAEIAQALDAPLDLLLVRKIGCPQQPELAMGAIVDGGAPIVVRNPDVIAMSGTDEATFAAVCRRELAEIERRRRVYLRDRPPYDPAGKTAIVVDDGIATGATMRAALDATRRRKPETLVLAVPVASPETLASLAAGVDEIVCLERRADLAAVGYAYRDFRQLDDADVLDILKSFRD